MTRVPLEEVARAVALAETSSDPSLRAAARRARLSLEHLHLRLTAQEERVRRRAARRAKVREVRQAERPPRGDHRRRAHEARTVAREPRQRPVKQPSRPNPRQAAQQMARRQAALARASLS